MSINWVMLDPGKGFIHLPNEKRMWTSPSRTSLSINTPKAYPGNNPLNIQSDNGTIDLTNQRVVYLPSTSTPTLQSFSAPLLNLHDSHVTAPWFGPNVWEAVLQPVPGGGIIQNSQSSSSHIEVKFTFKDGGAYDFHTNFERLKERMVQVVEEARERNLTTNATGGQQVDLSQVHLEDLPAYDAGPGSAPGPSAPPNAAPGRDLIDLQRTEVPAASTSLPESRPMPPDGPPPGYEETQQQSVAEEFERRLSGQT